MEMMMRRAHVALEFSAQEKQPWAGYSEKADRCSKKKLTLVADLRNAIACDQGLFLHYQPQFNCQNGQVTGVEVLLRWDHPVYGPLPADEIVALADFGTGFSSLAYLKKMPVSELKIDRSFIQELCDNHEDQVIIAAIISMCQGLGIEVVAEGIEDMATQLKLESLGCDRLQGYFLAKPLLGTDLLLRLANHSH
jgi:EAL domain-containing protein (putative c-di-GMP-specific phosphodiesterase class I)